MSSTTGSVVCHSWQLDCACGRRIRVPAASKPAGPFRCPDCRTRHSPDDLVAVLKDARRPTKSRVVRPAGALDSHLAQLQDRLVRGGNSRWLLPGILASASAPLLMIAAVLFAGLPPRPVEPARFDRTEPSGYALPVPGPTEIRVGVPVRSIEGLAAVHDCEVVVEIEDSEGLWQPAGMQRPEGSPRPSWGAEIDHRIGEEAMSATAAVEVEIPPAARERRCRFTVAGRFTAPVAIEARRPISPLEEMLRPAGRRLDGWFENRSGEFESTTIVQVGSEEGRLEAEGAHRRWEEERDTQRAAQSEYLAAKKRSDDVVATPLIILALVPIAGVLLFQAGAAARR